jgi:hypothetical protein
MVGIEELARRRVEELIAVGLYQARANRVRGYVMMLYGRYEKYSKPIEDVREILARLGEKFKPRGC